MPKFILDPCVEDELWSIWYFIAQDNPDAATRVIEAAYETFKTLAANPGLGRLRQFRSPGSAMSVPGALQVLKIT